MAATGYVSPSGDPRKISKTGDMTAGDLVLADSTPDTPNSAAPKSYVDAAVAAGSGAVASVNGATGDVVLDAAGVGALSTAGGTLSGPLAAQRVTAEGWNVPLLGASQKRPAWRPASWMQNFQTGHGWTTTGTVGSSNLNDTSTFVRGTQCATITSNGAGASGNLARTGMTATDLTGKAIRLLLKVDDTTHVSSLNFFVGTSGMANNFKWRCWNVTSSTRMIQSGEWVTVTLQWADVNLAAGSYSLSANGVPSTTSGFTDMMFQVVDDAGGTVTAHLQTVELIPDTTTTFPSGVVSITFDDSWKSVHDYARPAMDTYGYRGTTYTIAEAIGSDSQHLSLADLRSVQDLSGWEVAGHAYMAAAHTARYPSLTAQQVEDEVRNLKAWLVSNEFTSDAFAFPGGQFGVTTDGVPVDQLVSKYFNTGRSINYLGTTEMFPPAMPRRMRALSSIGSVISTGDPANVTRLTGAGGMLDRCQRSGSWLILTFHQIVTTAPTDPVQCSVADFQTVMAAINSRGIPVLPVGDVIRNYL